MQDCEHGLMNGGMHTVMNAMNAVNATNAMNAMRDLIHGTGCKSKTREAFKPGLHVILQSRGALWLTRSLPSSAWTTRASKTRGLYSDQAGSVLIPRGAAPGPRTYWRTLPPPGRELRGCLCYRSQMNKIDVRYTESYTFIV